MAQTERQNQQQQQQWQEMLKRTEKNWKESAAAAANWKWEDRLYLCDT